MSGGWREQLAVFWLAVQFLTRIPIPSGIRFSEPRLQATAAYYPLVGILVGALVAAVFVGLCRVFPPPLAVLGSMAVSLLLTGAFHEDGFADACDGLGGGLTADRALEIMKDSRLGTYGAAGLMFMLAGKFLTLVATPVELVPWLLVVGHCVSRASATVVLATSRYLRAHGTAKPLASGVSPSGLGFACATGLTSLAALAAAASGVAALGALGGCALGHLAMRRVFERKLGGYTGDCLGAVQQTSELGLYLGVLACL